MANENENPFGPLPIDGHEPAPIVAQLAENLRVMSDAEAAELLRKVEALLQAFQHLQKPIGLLLDGTQAHLVQV